MNTELPSLLRTPEGPWLLEFVGTPAKAYEFAWAVAKHGIASRVLRGSKMATLQATFDEIGAGLQFPQYFGENQAALAECITDMSWLPAEAYVVVVADAIRLLEHDSDDRFAMLVETFSEAGPEWATPIERGEWWDRPARPFHVVLQVEAESREELRSRFEATEAELARWEDWRQAPTSDGVEPGTDEIVGTGMQLEIGDVAWIALTAKGEAKARAAGE